MLKLGILYYESFKIERIRKYSWFNCLSWIRLMKILIGDLK